MIKGWSLLLLFWLLKNLRPGHVARAASSTGRKDHASPPSPPIPTVLHKVLGQVRIWGSTMRCRWHLHVANASPVRPGDRRSPTEFKSCDKLHEAVKRAGGAR